MLKRISPTSTERTVVIIDFSLVTQHICRRWCFHSVILLLVALFSPQVLAGSPKRAMVLIYDGVGTPRGAQVWGRVLQDKGFDHPNTKESWYRRLKRSYRLLESDEIPNAKVELRLGKRAVTVLADKEGLFQWSLAGLKPGVHDVSARLLGGLPYRQRSGRVYVAPLQPGIAVLSDIDDTVLVSGVKNKLKLIKKVLLGNVHDLKSYRHAPALYRRFASAGHPLVFVSGSPVNLQPRLAGFFKLRKFPRAPMLLKNLGVGKKADSLLEQRAYKLGRIERVLRLLPGYRLILIGDSGEKDPEIYRTIAQRYPRRVAAILIHDVSSPKRRAKDAAQSRFAGQLLFRSYLVAARALKKRGLISAADLVAVEAAP